MWCRIIDILYTHKKNKKGKHLLAVSLKRDDTSTSEICKIVKSTAKTVDNWLNLYDQGLSKEPSEFEGKKLSNGDYCELYGACGKYLY